MKKKKKLAKQKKSLQCYTINWKSKIFDVFNFGKIFAFNFPGAKCDEMSAFFAIRIIQNIS